MSLAQLLTSAPFTGPKNPDAVLADIPKGLKKVAHLVRRYVPFVKPEATEEICERRVPGIPEAMRAYSMTITKRAMLSRSAAGIRKKTLIINLPGSPKAVRESLEYIIDALGHGIEIMTGEAGNCAR